MKKTTLWIMCIAVFVVVSMGGYYAARYLDTHFGTGGWKTYTNTKYGYTLKYPPDESVSIVGGESALPPIEELDNPVIGEFMGMPTFGIDAYTSSPSYRQLADLSLRDLAEAIREYQVNDKNPYEPNKRTGDLFKITFAGDIAYSFTQTDGFTGPTGGYVLMPMGSPFNYIFVENRSGIKLMIRYLISDKDAEKIADSFKFTD